MACPITLTGISLGCKDNVGGVQEVYIIDKAKVTATPTVTLNKITAIATGTDNFSVYNFKRNTASLVSTPTINYENDTLYYSSVLTLKFNKLDTVKRTEFVNLAKGNLAVIVKDANGVYWYLGFDNEVSVTGGSATTGVAMGDMNGYEIQLTDLSKQLPYEVDSTIITALIS